MWLFREYRDRRDRDRNRDRDRDRGRDRRRDRSRSRSRSRDRCDQGLSADAFLLLIDKGALGVIVLLLS